MLDESGQPPVKGGAQPTPASGGKDSLDDLASIDLGMLDLFQMPGAGAPAKPGAKPPAKPGLKLPGKGPSKDDPLNLGDLGDLNLDGEKKPSPKKGGGGEPINPDDFDLSKFKL